MNLILKLVALTIGILAIAEAPVDGIDSRTNRDQAADLVRRMNAASCEAYLRYAYWGVRFHRYDIVNDVIFQTIMDRYDTFDPYGIRPDKGGAYTYMTTFTLTAIENMNSKLRTDLLNYIISHRISEEYAVICSALLIQFARDQDRESIIRMLLTFDENEYLGDWGMKLTLDSNYDMILCLFDAYDQATSTNKKDAIFACVQRAFPFIKQFSSPSEALDAAKTWFVSNRDHLMINYNYIDMPGRPGETRGNSEIGLFVLREGK